MPLAILQARTAATRMPGKVMAPILGEPMIWRQIERVRRARTLSKVVVATSTSTADDALTGFLLGRGCTVFRGEMNDLLGRMAACAAACHADHVVRLCADSPLLDPQVIDAAVSLALASGAAYTSNCERRSFPRGLEVEVITAEALAAAAREATDPAEREQVTAYLRARPQRFPQAHLTQAEDSSALRWTVERSEDFAFVRAVYERLYRSEPAFCMEDVLELLATDPEIAALAARAEQAATAPLLSRHAA